MKLEKFQCLEYVTVLDVPAKKKENEPISPVNEIILRAFFNDQFQIPIPSHINEFIEIKKYKNIELKVNVAA